jgi:hypothetical protein
MMKVLMLKLPMRLRRVMPSRRVMLLRIKKPPMLRMRVLQRKVKRLIREIRKDLIQNQRWMKRRLPIHWPNLRMKNFSQNLQNSLPKHKLKKLMRSPKRKSITLG